MCHCNRRFLYDFETGYNFGLNFANLLQGEDEGGEGRVRRVRGHRAEGGGHGAVPAAPRGAGGAHLRRQDYNNRSSPKTDSLLALQNIPTEYSAETE